MAVLGGMCCAKLHIPVTAGAALMTSAHAKQEGKATVYREEMGQRDVVCLELTAACAGSGGPSGTLENAPVSKY